MWGLKPTFSNSICPKTNDMATRSTVLRNDTWILPDIRQDMTTEMVELILTFDRSMPIDANTEDDVHCDPKVKTRLIWESIRTFQAHLHRTEVVWHKLHVPRYVFIQWLSFHYRLSTRDRLHRFGLVQSTKCILCIAGEESQDHLLLHCPYSSYVLHKILLTFAHCNLPSCSTWVNSSPLPRITVTMQHLTLSYFWLCKPIRTICRDRGMIVFMIEDLWSLTRCSLSLLETLYVVFLLHLSFLRDQNTYLTMLESYQVL